MKTTNHTSLEWVTNHYRHQSEEYHSPAEKEQEQSLYRQFVLGPPKATDTYTVQQLLAMKMVGFYKKVRKTTK